MKLRTILATGLIAGLMAVSALAADVSGKWAGETAGRNGQTRPVTLTLKADGSNLTGEMSGMRGGSNPISEGKVDGDNVSFVVKVEFNGNEMKMNYSGKVEGATLNLKMSREGSDTTRDISLKRAE